MYISHAYELQEASHTNLSSAQRSLSLKPLMSTANVAAIHYNSVLMETPI